MLHNHIKTISHFRFFLLLAKMLRLKNIILTLCKQVKDLTEKRDIINKCTMSLFKKKMNFPIIEIRLMGLNEKTNSLIFAYKHV